MINKLKQRWSMALTAQKQRRVLLAHLDAQQNTEHAQKWVELQWGLSRAHLTQQESLIYVQVPCDFLLDFAAEDHQRRLNILEDIGLRRSANLHYSGHIGPNKIQELLNALQSAWSSPLQSRYSLCLNPKEPPQNRVLQRALKRLTIDRTEDARRALYQESLKHYWFIPARLPKLSVAGESQSLTVVDNDGIWPIFSKHKECQNYVQPRGEFLVAIGYRWVRAALEQKQREVSVNPGGDISGAFFANELETMGRAMGVI